MYEKGTLQEWNSIEHDYNYVWHKETVIRARFFLLGDSGCHDKNDRSHCYTNQMVQDEVDKLNKGLYS